jgi:hypothetical protein
MMYNSERMHKILMSLWLGGWLLLMIYFVTINVMH